MKTTLSAVIVFGLIFAIGAAVYGYEAIDVKGGGTITGVVKFVGAVPPPKKIEATQDQGVCGNFKESEELIVSPDTMGIKNVLISLSDIQKGKAFEKGSANPALTQKNCWFTPHVLLIPAASTVDVLNNDPLMHNIHTTSTKNPVVNKAQPKFKKTLSFALNQPEKIKVNCDIHSWMQAYFIVIDHPYSTLTDEEGAFKLTNVPPGTYTLQAWHEILGEQTEKVTVKANEETKVVFELKGGHS